VNEREGFNPSKPIEKQRFLAGNASKGKPESYQNKDSPKD